MLDFVTSVWIGAKEGLQNHWKAILSLILVAGSLVIWWAQSGSKPDPINHVGRAWNDSIARLGIRPLFPPAEDLHVGDVFAVLRRLNVSGLDEVSIDGRLADRSIRIGRIDLTDFIAQQERARPILDRLQAAPNPVKAAGGEAADKIAAPIDEPDFAVGTPTVDRLVLKRLMFPGITIAVSHSAGIGDWFQSLAGGASRYDDEVINIGHPLTYGIDTEYAFAMLGQFCGAKDKSENIRCDAAYLRRLIAAQFGPDACLSDREKGYGIDLMLVSRVYVSQAISVSRAHDLDVELQRRMADRADVPAAGQLPDKRLLPAGISAGEGGAYRRYSRLASEARQVRPLVFGYHAVSVEAEAKPGREFRCNTR